MAVPWLGRRRKRVREIMRLERPDNIWELAVLFTALIVALLVAYWTGKI